MTESPNPDMVPCANPACLHRKVHHHPRAGVCMASDRGEFCPCDEYEAPVELACTFPVATERGRVVECREPIMGRWMETVTCRHGHVTIPPRPEETEPEQPFVPPIPPRSIIHMGDSVRDRATGEAHGWSRDPESGTITEWTTEPGPMTESRFDALAREAATEEKRCICGYIRAAHHGRRGTAVCPEFRPDPFAGEAIQFVHDAVDAAFEKRRRNLLAADKRRTEGE